MSENAAVRTTETIGELAGSGARFARALKDAEPQIEIPRDEAAPNPTPDAPKSMGSLWVNKENEPEPDDESKQWLSKPKLDQRTWAETIGELDAVMAYRHGRTWAEYGQQVLDTALNELHPTLKDYKAPEPTREIPEWWQAVREPMAKLMEGLGRMPWFKAVWTSTKIAVPLIPLPGFGFWNVPFIIIGAAFRARVQHLDWVARWIVQPVAKPIYYGVKAIVDYGGFAWVADNIVDPAGRWIGKKYTEFKDGRKKKYNEKVEKWAEDGDSHKRAVSVAEWDLYAMTSGLNAHKVKMQIDAAAPCYQRDLLRNFGRPMSLVNLDQVKADIESGERFKLFTMTINNMGYEARLVNVGETVIVEIWKTGTSPDVVSDELRAEDIPHPRAHPAIVN